ncbi:MAG: SDR family NAD(P)-dependent oxidoreductase [Solirubrobacterales bacterium]
MSRLDSTPVVIVTGAAGGIGRAAVRLLAAEGVIVVAVDREEEQLQAAAAAAGGSVKTVVADVASEAEVERYVSYAMSLGRGLDGVFNLAGFGGEFSNIGEASTENYDEVMTVNAKSVWLSMKHTIQALVETGGGTIVNTGSYLAIRGQGFTSAYAASKHAVVGMTKSVALEYAQQNVRAHVICPASTDTPMIREMMAVVAEDPNEGERITVERQPNKRLADPEEPASVGVWLLLHAPTHLSGTVIPIDGGRSAG